MVLQLHSIGQTLVLSQRERTCLRRRDYSQEGFYRENIPVQVLLCMWKFIDHFNIQSERQFAMSRFEACRARIAVSVKCSIRDGVQLWD
jgi:hypothetical protein